MYSFQNSAVSNIPSIPESTVSNKILLEEYDVVENCLHHFKILYYTNLIFTSLVQPR